MAGHTEDMTQACALQAQAQALAASRHHMNYMEPMEHDCMSCTACMQTTADAGMSILSTSSKSCQAVAFSVFTTIFGHATPEAPGMDEGEIHSAQPEAPSLPMKGLCSPLLPLTIDSDSSSILQSMHSPMPLSVVTGSSSTAGPWTSAAETCCAVGLYVAPVDPGPQVSLETS